MTTTYTSFPTIGILGGGQLGRMTALAAMRMGLNVKTLSPEPSGPVSSLGISHVGDWNDEMVMRRFLDGCDVITVESEWAPVELAERVSQGVVPVWPSSTTVKAIRHKGRQKSVLNSVGIPQADHCACQTLDEAIAALDQFGGKVMAKKYEGSYDGYGNATVTSHDGMQAAWEKLSASDGLLVESFLPFVKEIAVLVARSPSGASVVYPVVDTEQREHRCHAVSVPAQISSSCAEMARNIALSAADAVESVGILGVELFEMADGSILLNELAPRPHNTGHYTIEACHTSQFENHVRAILDYPLGDPSLKVPAAAMVNILGHRKGQVRTEGYSKSLELSRATIHLYGKLESRPQRKMGHVTVTADDVHSARKHAEAAAAFVKL